INVTRGKHVLASVTVTELPGSALCAPIVEPVGGQQEQTRVEEHLHTHSDIVVVMLPVSLLGGNQETLRLQQSYLHDILQNWLFDASAPHRAVVLAPARVDELAPTLSTAQCLIDKRLVRQLFGKVHSLLCHARPQPEWYVAPLSGFGFVPKQLWRAST